ncbi:membrane protein insertion efficiency factor YidD [Fusibacter sp. JL298sf-3]
MRYIFIYMIKWYRKVVSPFLGSNCRFEPTCSRYAMQAFEKYGTFKGGYLTVRRLLKCHPFHPGGYDPLE